jgi:hypothetical protein
VIAGSDVNVQLIWDHAIGSQQMLSSADVGWFRFWRVHRSFFGSSAEINTGWPIFENLRLLEN